MTSLNDQSILEIRAKCYASFLYFTQLFYEIRTGREFILTTPVANEPHVITISKTLMRAFNLENNRFMINCPPGWGKSELIRHFVAWAFIHYADCQFIYISYSQMRSEENTAVIKEIMTLPEYKKMFGIELHPDMQAKSNFKTKQGGSVVAFGSAGPVVGQDAGLPILERFSGGVLIDDAHKPDEVHSDTTRERVIRNYQETISQRPRSVKVPIIFIGQRLHEGDLPGQLLGGLDGYDWDKTILAARDSVGNIVNPKDSPAEKLDIEEKYNKYTFWSQQMQQPQPSGGALFKEKDFVLLDKDPEIFYTFMTIDTAETTKTYNDATVFSFWGVYQIPAEHGLTGELGLHWMNCVEFRAEPRELVDRFMSFYRDTSRQGVPAQLIAIEKKSTGVGFISSLEQMRGITIFPLERHAGSGSKATRFIQIQPFIARRLVSINKYASFKDQVVDHCMKLTANDSHAHDDIGDTLVDAVTMVYINPCPYIKTQQYSNRLVSADAATLMQENMQREKTMWSKLYGTNQNRY